MTTSLDDGPAVRARSLGGGDRSRRLVHQALRDWVTQTPDAPFVKCRADWVTFAELDARSDRVAAGLAAAGVSPGDRVAVVLDNCDEFVEIVFVCSKLGATQVPLNTFLRGEFLSHQLADCGASTLIADRSGIAAHDEISDRTIVERVISVGCTAAGAVPFDVLRACADPVPDHPVTPEDIAAVIYTSGTTGMPKGCMLPHGYLTLVPSAYIDSRWVIPGDRICTPFPLFHLSGQTIVLQTALQLGISVFVTPRFRPAGSCVRPATKTPRCSSVSGRWRRRFWRNRSHLQSREVFGCLRGYR
jgi:carnitine-CoA ligase